MGGLLDHGAPNCGCEKDGTDEKEAVGVRFAPVHGWNGTKALFLSRVPLVSTNQRRLQDD